MLDIALLRKEPHSVAQLLAKRGFALDTETFIALETERKTLQTETETLQSQRNTLSREIGKIKAQGGDSSAIMAEVGAVNAKLKGNAEALDKLQTTQEAFLLEIPNIPDHSVPLGKDENDNQECKRHGEVPQFNFDVADHVTLGNRLGLNFDLAAQLSGSRFMVLQGALARLHRALTQFMLDAHIANGYTECYVPYIVNKETLTGTGQLPKFKEDLFHLNSNAANDDAQSANSGKDWYLIPTSEVPLTNTVAHQIVPESSLPLKLTAHTPCFRSEAGSHGRDTRGMIRQHQFDKVEMVQIVKPEDSDAAHKSMVASAESILQDLELPYRIVLLCSGDMGFAAQKTYDLEVWLPAQECYREISSVSNCGDFQSRRMRARTKIDGKSTFLHTLNGSGLAIGRTLVALLENHQQADGSIYLPLALRPYMGGLEKISA